MLHSPVEDCLCKAFDFLRTRWEDWIMELVCMQINMPISLSRPSRDDIECTRLQRGKARLQMSEQHINQYGRMPSDAVSGCCHA